jgi:hypothetical protein
MELLESNDPKAELLRKAAGQKKALEDEVKVISDRTEKVIKNALVIGGVLAATYLLYSIVSDSGSKKTKRKARISKAPELESEEETTENDSGFSSVIGKIGATLASQASVFLLALAKEKLSEYLQQKAASANESHL